MNKNSNELFGYDRYGFSLYEGAIVKFTDPDGIKRIGQLFWCLEDKLWTFSLAHDYGERRQDAKGCKNFKLIMYLDSDVKLARRILQDANWD